MIPKEVDLWLGTYLVPRAEMLYCTCNSCTDYIDWKHTVDLELAAFCCGVAWKATVHNRKGSMLAVRGEKADLTNVVLLPVDARTP